MSQYKNAILDLFFEPYTCWPRVNIGLGNDLVRSGTKTFPVIMLTETIQPYCFSVVTQPILHCFIFNLQVEITVISEITHVLNF